MLNRNIKSVYISGPMTGYDYYNFPAFHEAADMLRRRFVRRGLVVYSPAEMDVDDGVIPPRKTEFRYTKQYLRFLMRDLHLLSSGLIDAIVVLPGWDESRGACAEVVVARLLEIPVFRYPDLQEIPDA